jgi:hypothetical protein
LQTQQTGVKQVNAGTPKPGSGNMRKMKLLIQSAMIFFGTLMAAAVVALGEPGKADEAFIQSAAMQSHKGAQMDAVDSHPLVRLASNDAGLGAR